MFVHMQVSVCTLSVYMCGGAYVYIHVITYVVSA